MIFSREGYFFKGMRALCGALLVAMVAFTAYTIVMRYVFQDPPFWGDTLSIFANVGLVMFAFSVSVRDNEHISMQGLYAFLPRRGSQFLEFLWSMCIFAFGIFMVYFGYEAATNVPGQYWELNGLKKMYPMLIMPLSGFVVSLSALLVILEHLANQDSDV